MMKILGDALIPNHRQTFFKGFWLISCLIMMALLFGGCDQKAQKSVTEENEGDANLVLNGLQSEREPNEAIEDMAVQVFQIEATLGENYYQYARVDLNRDGNEEILVWLYGANFSSGEGDGLMLLSAEGALIQAFHSIHAPITISHSETGRYRSFYMYNKEGRYARFDFGIQYPAEMDLAAEVSFSDLEGEVVFESLEDDVCHLFLN